MDFREALREPKEEPQPEPRTPAVFQPQAQDLTPVKDELAQYEASLAEMEKESKVLAVESGDTEKRAVALAGGAKTLHKSLKKALETLTGPANDYVKAVRNLFRPYLDRLEAAEHALKKKIADYSYQQRLEQQRKEAEAREAARRQQEKIDAEQRAIREEAERKAAEAAKDLEKEKDEARRAALEKTIADETAAAQAQPPVVIAPVIEQKPTVTRTETGSGHLRMDWTFEVTDPAQVPRKYLEVNERAIRADVKAGIREIPGVRIFEKPIMNIRT